MRIPAVVWQKPIQHCKTIFHKLKKQKNSQQGCAAPVFTVTKNLCPGTSLVV